MIKKFIFCSLLLFAATVYGMEKTTRELAIELFNTSSGWRDLVGQMPQEDLVLELYKCLSKGDEVTFYIFLEIGADINAPLDNGNTLLHRCIIECNSKNHCEKCRFLLDNGASVNCQRKTGETPLHLAAQSKRIGICKFLLERGAKLNICNSGLSTPLHKAAIAPYAAFAPQSQRYAKIYPHEAAQAEELCEMMIQHQELVNKSIIGALLCFYRLKKEKHPASTLLYNQRATLLLPYLEADRYISLNKLLNMKNEEDCTPYDYLPVACLYPNRFAKKSWCVVQ